MAAKSRKLVSGQGWSFEPADAERKEDIVSLPDARQSAKVALAKRAKGKEVTLVTGFVLSPADRRELAAELRRACGSGGTDSDAGVEVQGDHREKVKRLLAGKGWNMKG